MPAFPQIATLDVRVGLWWNLGAPAYRRCLWTVTNLEAVVVLGVLGIVGTVAGDRVWLIVRPFLQPSLRISGAGSRTLNPSRTDAVKALWVQLKRMKQDLAIPLAQHKTWQQVKSSCQKLRGRQSHSSRPPVEDIKLQVGLFAIFNIMSTIILGIFGPFFLAEGLQGEAVVRATSGSRQAYLDAIVETADDKYLRARHKRDVEHCVAWTKFPRSSDYCSAALGSLPPYMRESISLDDLAPTNPRHRFLIEHADRRCTALRLRWNATLHDVFVNTKSSSKWLSSELVCVPVLLGRFVERIEGRYVLNIDGLLSYGSNLGNNVRLNYQDWFKASLVMKADHWIKWRRPYRPPGLPSYAEWTSEFRFNRDGILPWIQDEDSKTRARQSVALLRGEDGVSLQNFFITYQPNWEVSIKGTPNKPDFGADHQRQEHWYVNNELVLSIGCAETFLTCEEDQCKEPGSGNDTSSWLHHWYPFMSSIWLNDQLEYDSDRYPRIFDDFRYVAGEKGEPDGRWRHDVMERFLRSMLLAQHVLRSASQASVKIDSSHWRDTTVDWPLLYHNSDYTNLNVYGAISTLLVYTYIIAASCWPVLFGPVTLIFQTSRRISGISSTFIKSVTAAAIDWARAICSWTSKIADFVRLNRRNHHSTATDAA